MRYTCPVTPSCSYGYLTGYSRGMGTRLVSASYLRSFIFGVEDSLVSTVGLVSGIALAGVAGTQILLTGIILVFVEAFSMAAGEYLSERSSEEYMEQGVVSPWQSIVASVIMFFSYLLSGIIPIAPYAFLAPQAAFTVSVVGSLAALFLLGLLGARLTGTPLLSRATQMAVVGGMAIIIGIAVGQLTGLGV